MQDGREFVVADFSAGVGFDGDLTGGDLKRLVDSKFARQIVNLSPTGAGSLRGRRGCTQVAGTGNNYAGKRLAALDNGPAGIPRIIDSSGSLISETNLQTGTRTSILGAYGLTTGITAYVQAPLSADGKGPLFMQNGTDTPFYWTGGGNIAAWVKNAANATAIPKGTLMAYTGNRIWISGDSAQPSRLYYSSLNATGGCDPGNFDSVAPNDGGFIDLAPNDGQAITALVPHGPYLMVFKEHKIFLLYDPAGGPTNRMVSDQFGLSSAPSTGGTGAVSTPYGVVFLADAGSVGGGATPYFRPFITDGTSVRPLGRLPFSPLLQSAATMRLSYFEGRLYIGGTSTLSLASGGTLNCALEYQFETDSWWIHQLSTGGGNSEVWGDAIVARDYTARTLRLFACCPSSAKLYKLFDNDTDGLDGGNGYAWKYVSPWYTLGSRLKRKRVDAIVLEPQAGGAVVESQVDVFGSWTVLDGVALPTTFQSRFYTPAGSAGQGGGVLWSVRVSSTVSSGRPNLAALGFEYGSRRD